MTHPAVQVLGGGFAELARPDPADGQLLELFVRHRDQEAFALLVRRHGPLVLGVCRRVLGNPADADDAFQAAFLVLARKAAGLATRGPLAAWLHGVAYNTARRLRRMNTRRATRERPVGELPEPAAPGEADGREELLAALDEELGRLPDRYRLPLVLCDLQGTTRKEAARLLGCPEGTVAGRLARARALLAARLTGRGIAPAAGVLAVLSERAAAVAFPAIVASTVRLATEPGPLPPRVGAAAEGVLKAMFLKKLQAAGVLFAAAALAGLGLVHLTAAQPLPGPAPDAKKAAEAPPPGKPPAADEPTRRVPTVIPLKKLDATATARVLSDAYRGKGVTVSAIPDDRVLLVYADGPTTRDIEQLLQKLGEEPRKRATVVRLHKQTDCTDAARVIAEAFGGKPRVTIVPVPDENALLVYADEADTRTILKLLDKAVAGVGEQPAKPAAPAPAAGKTFTFRMREVPWKDVLQWYSDASDVPLLARVFPTGNFTFEPPADKQFTLEEITDIINEALIAQKFLLIRQEKSFTLVPADEKIDPSLVPRVTLNELEKRGKTDLVAVAVQLKRLKARDVAREIEKLLGPFGEVVVLESGNVLVIRDLAGNLRRTVATLKAIDEGER